MIHLCALSSEPMLNVLNKQRNSSKLRFWMLEKCMVWDMHPHSRQYFRSESAIRYEMERHFQLYDKVIHPFSRFAMFWESVMVFAICVNLVLQPLCSAFEFDVVSSTLLIPYVLMVINVIFTTDLIINFNKGYGDDFTRTVTLDRSLIAKRYLRGMFLIDLVSSVPWDLMAHTLFPDTQQGRNVMLTMHLIALISLLRIGTLMTYLKTILDMWFFSGNLQMLIRHSIGVIFLLHWTANLHYLVPNIQRHFNGGWFPESWTTTWQVIYLKSKVDRYIHSLFRATCQLSATDHGLFPIESLADMLVTTCTYIVGYIYITFVTVMALHYLMSRKSSEIKYQEVMSQLDKYILYKQLPIETQERILYYYEYKFQKFQFREETIQDFVPESLNREINYYASRKLIENVSLLQEFSQDVAGKILSCMKIEIYLPNDIIINAGAPGECMYFLGNGTVAVYTPSGKEVCHLEEGSYFGEIALVLRDRRIATVIAIEICEVYRLSKEDFQKYIASEDHLLRRFTIIAERRIKKTYALEERHKQYLLDHSTKWEEGF
ncbi:potassium/sodium hyperpolarization-activated cyclic nucleotide-gated channel 1-like [Agrilus planipennis]|uniref:Potassium/sodium hyperpolarization-activated cyclic nucleotide-gated channel 1-like n=1 Tax=Agrilus planipennis TaxID=224129 RepID=A0A1W4W4A9_AGRPL|nr:potassium/sodium hyperpolarization-activated cyclic nucleotide-gated channel 1-like [Agrilus planipennis]